MDLRRVALGLVLPTVLGGTAAAAEPTAFTPSSERPPAIHGGSWASPNPPAAWRPVARSRAALSAAQPAAYSIGEPTDAEQLYVELINRARADPAAEGLRLVNSTDAEVRSSYEFFEVDLNLVASQFRALAAAPPVSIHAQLTEAARRHSRDMLAAGFQGHDGSDGSTSASRVEEAGYDWNALAENVFAHARSVWHGHAGLNVDWGLGPGGIQSPPGHRETIHDRLYREIGVGVVLGSNGPVGPQLVTQEFAMKAGSTPFLTGVVFYDYNGNQFYDLGEGLGGVTVRASGVATYAVTARSGGYSIPVPGNGSYSVTFSVPGLEPVSKTATVANGANAKVDHVPPYSAPVLGGSSIAYVGRGNAYLFSPVGGATGYQWRFVRRNPWIEAEGAESGLLHVEADASPGYDVVSTAVRQSGSASFHLAHPQPPRAQHLVFKEPLRLGASSALSFWSRLGIASSTQVARAQISTDNGGTWSDVWSQAGSGVPGEQGFSQHVVPLHAWAGQIVALRFAYTVAAGNYYPQTDAGVGWYLDDLLVTDAERLRVQADPPESVVGNSFRFRPPEPGGYLLQVRALIGDRTLEWGPALSLTAQEGGGPGEIRVTGFQRDTAGGGGWLLSFTVEGPASGLAIEEAPAVEGPWRVVEDAAIPAPDPAGVYRVQLPPRAGGARFLRVAAP